MEHQDVIKKNISDLLEDRAQDAVETLIESDDIAKMALALAAAKKAQVDQRNRKSIGKIDKIRVRVRGGKIQHNVLISNTKGWKVENGKIVRMSFMEKKRRKLAARIASRKRHAKQSIINQRTARSLLKRNRALGV